MKTLMKKVGIVFISCTLFTIIGPIVVTSAQHHLFSFGFAMLFLFFGTCLYLVMTSTFFDSNEKAEKVELDARAEIA